jgi:site-specific DNA-methyltransferase (adenine-specific)
VINPALFSSESENWATPQDVFDRLNYVFNFTLDPCASPDNAKCKKYYTKEVNGLTKDWGGHKVFCNPPYGRDNTGLWIKKCAEESKKPGTIVVELVPARTDTRWFHDYIYPSGGQIYFLRGRLKFGDSKNSAPFPSMIIIFGMHWMYLKESDLNGFRRPN